VWKIRLVGDFVGLEKINLKRMERNQMKPGDWKCQNCNDINFASRQSCRTCSISKPQEQKHGMKAGDWICPKCNELVFASKNSCFKCGYSKDSNKAANKPNDWNCSCGELNFGSRDKCRKCSKLKVEVGSFVQKSGDWKCLTCNDINFASRTVCRKCNAKNPTIVHESQAQTNNTAESKQDN